VLEGPPVKLIHGLASTKEKANLATDRALGYASFIDPGAQTRMATSSGLDVKLSALAESMVLSAVELCALRMMGLGDVGGSMSKARCRRAASQSIGRSHHRQRPGRDVRSRAERELLMTTLYAVASFADQRKSVPSAHIRCRMTARFRATATLALRMPMRLARRMPQAFSADHFWTRVSNTPAAS
jgi:hypothetical protein